MWLAERAGAQMDTAPDIRIGRVTIGGTKCAVMLDGEVRNVEVAAPKGYGWIPEVGDEVLVLKTEGEWFIIAGSGCSIHAQQGRSGIYSDTASVSVGLNGVELCGDVDVKGTLMINGVDILRLINKS